MENARSPRLYGWYAMAAALVVASFIMGGAVSNIRRADDAVTVTGSARRAIRSDHVVWRLVVSTQASTLASGSQELQRNAALTRDFLKAQGVPDSVITVKPIETYTVMETLPDRGETGRVVGYRLQQMYEIRSSDVDGITQLTQRSGDLISQGVALMSNAPEYLFTRLADLRIELLEEATKDAKQRAEAITRSTGGEVGAVREARMGVFQITPRFSTEVSDYGVYDVSSIDKDVTAVVRVTFAVK